MNHTVILMDITSPITVRYFASTQPSSPPTISSGLHTLTYHITSTPELPRKLTLHPLYIKHTQKHAMKLYQNMCNICVKP